MCYNRTKHSVKETKRMEKHLVSSKYVSPAETEAQRTQKLRVFKYHYLEQLKEARKHGDVSNNLKALLDDVKLKNPLRSEFLVEEEKHGLENDFTIVWADKTKKKKETVKKIPDYAGSFLH